MELTTTKRVMLANLHQGQCIDHIVFDKNGKPAHVQSEIVNIEIHCNEGKLHTILSSTLADADVQIFCRNTAESAKELQFSQTYYYHTAIATRQ